MTVSTNATFMRDYDEIFNRLDRIEQRLKIIAVQPGLASNLGA